MTCNTQYIYHFDTSASGYPAIQHIIVEFNRSFKTFSRSFKTFSRSFKTFSRSFKTFRRSFKIFSGSFGNQKVNKDIQHVIVEFKRSFKTFNRSLRPSTINPAL